MYTQTQKNTWKYVLIGLVIFLSLFFSATNDTLYRYLGEPLSDSNSKMLGKVHTLLANIYFTALPAKLDQKFEELDVYIVTLNNESLEYWLRIAKPERLMDELIIDAQSETYGHEGWCHVPAHFIAHKAYYLYGHSPFTTDDTRCLYGYQHGLINTYIGEEGTEDNVRRLFEHCKSIERSRDRTLCIHGLGEGLTIHEDYDVPSALAQCDALGLRESEKTTCYLGVFMRSSFTTYDIFSDEHESTWISESPHFPCNVLPLDEVLGKACYLTQPLVLLPLYNNDIEKTIAECQQAPAEFISSCVRGIGFSKSIPPKKPVAEELFSMCRIMPNEELVRECMFGVVSNFVYIWGDMFENEARTFCSFYQNPQKGECLSRLEQLLL